MEHDLARLLLVVLLVPLAPIVTHSIGENASLSVECCRGDRGTGAWVSLESVLRVAVPKVECAVTTSSGEGTVFWMEGDGVHTVYVADIFVGG